MEVKYGLDCVSGIVGFNKFYMQICNDCERFLRENYFCLTLKSPINVLSTMANILLPSTLHAKSFPRRIPAPMCTFSVTVSLS